MALPLSWLDVSPDSTSPKYLLATKERQRRSKNALLYAAPPSSIPHPYMSCVFYVFNMSLRVLYFGSIFCSYQIRFRIGKVPLLLFMRLGSQLLLRKCILILIIFSCFFLPSIILDFTDPFTFIYFLLLLGFMVSHSCRGCV